MAQFTRVQNGITELVEDLFNDLQEGIEQQSFNVMRYGATGDGSTDDSDAIQDAITAAVVDGAAVYLPPGDYKITEQLSATDSFQLIGPGRILYPNDAIALRVNPTWGTAYDIDSFATEVFPAGVGLTCAKLGLDEYAQFRRGDIVLVYSTDNLGPDATADRGELRMVAGTATGFVYLTGILDDNYSTSPKIRKHPMCRVVIDGPTFTADGSPTGSESTRARAAVELVGCAHSRIRATFTDTWSRGLFMVSCYGCDVEVIARNCRDDVTNNAVGYGVDVACASRLCRVKVIATNCRHAVTSNSFAPATGDGYFGAPRNILVHDSLAHDCPSAAFDTHAAAYDWTFDNCHVVNQNEGDATTTGQRYAFNNRGANTTIQNSSLTGIGRFLFDSSATYDHDVKSVTRLVNCRATMTAAQYAVENDQFLFVLSGTAEAADHAIWIDGFYSLNFLGTLGGANAMTFQNCTFRNCDQFRVAADQTMTIRNCTRTWELAGDMEEIRIGKDATLYLERYTSLGDTENDSVLRGVTGTNGTWTVFGAHVVCPDGHAFKTDDSTGTWDVTDTAVAVA